LAKHLTERDIEKILGAIDGWQGKLTWDSLCDAVIKQIGKRPTRQSLNANTRIKQAFLDKKARLKGDFQETKTPPSLAIAGQRIKRLEEENARLKAENSRLLEQYVVWQYNAYRHGMSEEKLNASLPVIDREASS
jgi:hypothetical protein|tara:strand:+ start:203 stop:607 length:405 start_codon:yes stop_codon:yes gene_type:complete